MTGDNNIFRILDEIDSEAALDQSEAMDAGDCPGRAQKIRNLVRQARIAAKPLRSPDVTMKVWIDASGIQADINVQGTGETVCGSFKKTYDGHGQVAAMWAGFRDHLRDFIEDFRRKR